MNLQNDLRALILKRGLQHEPDEDVTQSLAGNNLLVFKFFLHLTNFKWSQLLVMNLSIGAIWRIMKRIPNIKVTLTFLSL